MKLKHLNYFSNLEQLEIYWMSLYNLPFSNHVNLRKLILMQCDFANIKSDAFKSLPSLEHLEIIELENYANVNYQGLNQLKWLKIAHRYEAHSNARLTFLESLESELAVLELTSWSISTKNTELLGDFQHKNLKVLNLNGNKFHKFEGKTWLRGLVELKDLDLSDCLISTITFGEHLYGLESLNLTRNKITLIDVSFQQLVKLKTLNLSKSGLELNSNIFVDKKELQELDISYLSEKGLGCLEKDVFKDLANLTILNLSGNKLASLGQGLFTYMPNLKWLDLKSNNLELKSDTFHGLEKLERLDLSSNSLEKLPVSLFSSLTRIESLNFSYNYNLEINEQTFDGLVSLKHVDLFMIRLDDRLFFALSELKNQLKLIKLTDFQDQAEKDIQRKLKDIFQSIVVFKTAIYPCILH